MQAFDTFGAVQPGLGTVHQANLEYPARGAHKKDGVYYPDTSVGTDSHTTIINGIGVVSQGVGGTEAEAGMLDQPVYLLTPDVVGVELKGCLREGCTATDLVLMTMEMLRREKIVGKFVEFFGESTASLSLSDRVTIGNMAPEYGATMGFFPVDEKTADYFRGTGHTREGIAALESYFKAQKLFGAPKAGEIDYTETLTLDPGTVAPSLAGLKRPRDRIEIGNVKSTFSSLFSKPVAESGFNKSTEDLDKAFMTINGVNVKSGDVLTAAITSCISMSNPSVLLVAGLLAKKTIGAGLEVAPHIKTSPAPGGRVVTKYLEVAGLLPYLERLGFGVTAYGCTTCIGNASNLTPELNKAIAKNDIVVAAVLSSNRNFGARIHPNIRTNFLASPPLAVTHVTAGNMTHNLMTEPIGKGKKGEDAYLGDIWPTSGEIAKLMRFAMNADTLRTNYKQVKKSSKPRVNVKGTKSQVYDWPKSTCIVESPLLESFGMISAVASASVKGAYTLGVFGDSVTTDHTSPAGSIKETSPIGKYLLASGVLKADFSSYGLCRGNHEVMTRGTLANVCIKNLMIPVKVDGSCVEGGETLFQPSGEQASIYDTATKYIAEGALMVVFGDEEYDTGSSCGQAVRGTQLLGVKAVIARSFERIHRPDLVGMGVLPLQFKGDDLAQSPGIMGDETSDIEGLDGEIKPRQDVTLVVHRTNGETTRVQVLLHIDTSIEVDYYKRGGILSFVLHRLLMAQASRHCAVAERKPALRNRFFIVCRIKQGDDAPIDAQALIQYVASAA